MAILKPSKQVERMRRQWTYQGSTRPAFAKAPEVGQESVWDYPRPPRIQPDPRLVEVKSGEIVLAKTNRSLRILETASPPTYYLPPEDVALTSLVETGGRSHCEWKGIALDLGMKDGPPSVGWVYPDTYAEFAEIAGWIAFYPAQVECSVDGERVRPQPGGFYGGWITNEIVGPVKGEPGCDGL
ncbi:MAG: DUF427 domain-containing protein [Myxococcota bacterium]